MTRDMRWGISILRPPESVMLLGASCANPAEAAKNMINAKMACKVCLAAHA